MPYGYRGASFVPLPSDYLHHPIALPSRSYITSSAITRASTCGPSPAARGYGSASAVDRVLTPWAGLGLGRCLYRFHTLRCRNAIRPRCLMPIRACLIRRFWQGLVRISDSHRCGRRPPYVSLVRKKNPRFSNLRLNQSAFNDFFETLHLHARTSS
jgi:hypothetical protein